MNEGMIENPFCMNCKEDDCLVGSDETCAMVNVYLATKHANALLDEVIKWRGLDGDGIGDPPRGKIIKYLNRAKLAGIMPEGKNEVAENEQKRR